eukprot:scaffold33238_cov129-Isochrysis_galbana.AAC.2
MLPARPAIPNPPSIVGMRHASRRTARCWRRRWPAPVAFPQGLRPLTNGVSPAPRQPLFNRFTAQRATTHDPPGRPFQKGSISCSEARMSGISLAGSIRTDSSRPGLPLAKSSGPQTW